jgi:cyclohexadienyl dehydratase
VARDIIGVAGRKTNVTGCAKKPPPPLSALDLIPQHGELRVCSTGDYRPFTYRDPRTNRWTGIDIDMAGDMAHQLGVRLTTVPSTWNMLADDVTANRCDVAMGGISINLKRARKAAYTDPYLIDGKTPITHCTESARFQTLDLIDRPGVAWWSIPVVVSTGTVDCCLGARASDF